MKKYSEMNLDELREATKRYDREDLNPKSYPVPARERQRHDEALRRAKAEAKRARGRPKLGRGARSVLITIDPLLLKSADAFAKKKKLSRSAFFSMSIARAIGT